MASSSNADKIRPPFTLKLAQTKDEIEACYDIRIEVFSVEQGFPLDCEIDEYDPIAFHFLLTTPIPSPPSEQSINPSTTSSSSETGEGQQTTEKAIGTIRYVPTLSKLTRLAIHKEYRKYGFGRVLVDGMHEWIKQNALNEKLNVTDDKEGKQVVKVKCHSQIPVIPFYARLGYVSEGSEFDEDGAPHQLMVKYIEI
ncbi:uncharacterized protein L201_001969 [Kwoniella dendrophila CBS 6074]|uniref:N-acetyltransferase domain-containing protein n=1 Tax=Kwoniella dendrophila CBS 6074 TaxID=1295534 RepID=A0AAX4JQD4_9TREE